MGVIPLDAVTGPEVGALALLVFLLLATLCSLRA